MFWLEFDLYFPYKSAYNRLVLYLHSYYNEKMFDFISIEQNPLNHYYSAFIAYFLLNNTTNALFKLLKINYIKSLINKTVM